MWESINYEELRYILFILSLYPTASSDALTHYISKVYECLNMYSVFLNSVGVDEALSMSEQHNYAGVVVLF